MNRVQATLLSILGRCLLQFIQAPEERRGCRNRSSRGEKPNHWHWLLPPRDKRPGSRAAERSDEISPSKANGHPALPCDGTLSGGRVARAKRAVLAFRTRGARACARLLHRGISAISAAGFWSEMGHKHRISVLLGPPLCRKWLQYLPNFVHRSENH